MKEIIMLVLAGVSAFLSGNMKTMTEQGTILLQSGRYEEAIAAYEEGYYDFRVERFECDRGLGITYYEMGDYEQAAKYLDLALEEGAVKTPSILQMLGISYLETGDVGSALSAFEDGLALPQTMVLEEGTEMETSVDYADVVQGLKYNRIVALEKLGNIDAAYQSLQAYVQEYPDDANAVKETEFYSTQYSGE